MEALRFSAPRTPKAVALNELLDRAAVARATGAPADGRGPERPDAIGPEDEPVEGAAAQQPVLGDRRKARAIGTVRLAARPLPSMTPSWASRRARRIPLTPSRSHAPRSQTPVPTSFGRITTLSACRYRDRARHSGKPRCAHVRSQSTWRASDSIRSGPRFDTDDIKDRRDGAPVLVHKEKATVALREELIDRRLAREATTAEAKAVVLGGGWRLNRALPSSTSLSWRNRS
jgi:hypothetical protein